MGSIYGWSGMGLGPDMSQQAIKAMLAECSGDASPGSENHYDNTGALCICEGIYATSFLYQDSIRAAIIGSPTWEDKELSNTAKEQGAGAALIKAWQAFGKKLLSKLHGPFALAVQDGDEALIAIDRIGIHSLSYSHQQGVFVFSTSTGSVVKHPSVRRQIDPQAIFNYLYFHDIPSPGTIYKGVEKLIPAQYIQFRNG
jgi:asparagine synthase (glutamine-hydrolysing)